MLATLIEDMVDLDETKRSDFLSLFEKVRMHQNHAREERALKVINDTQAVDSRGLNSSSSKPNKPNESKLFDKITRSGLSAFLNKIYLAKHIKIFLS